MWSIYVDITEHARDCAQVAWCEHILQLSVEQCGNCSWGGGQEEDISQVSGLHDLYLRLHCNAQSADKTNPPAFIILSCVQRQTVLGTWNANHIRVRASLGSTVFLSVCLLPWRNVGVRLSCALSFNCASKMISHYHLLLCVLLALLPKCLLSVITKASCTSIQVFLDFMTVGYSFSFPWMLRDSPI